MKPVYILVLLILLCLPGGLANAADEQFNPGYRSLVAWLPGNKVRVDLAVWYPTTRAPSNLTVGSWTFTGARNAAPVEGTWPLLLLSPDSSGSRFAHHHLAVSLARQGYIVAVPTHDGDNLDDMRYLFTARQLPARASQLSAALDLLLENPDLGPLIDQNRIHAVGFGNGGSAALLLAGAELTPRRWPSYCIWADPDDPYCSPDMRRNLDNMVASMHFADFQDQDAVINLEQAQASRLSLLEEQSRGITRATQQVNRAQRRPVTEFPTPPAFLPLLPPLPTAEQAIDRRLSSIILVSPGYSMLFEPESVHDLSVPLYLIGCAKDRLNQTPGQQNFFLELLQDRNRDFRLLSADLPALQATCPPDLAADMPELCNSATRSERDNLRQSLESLLKEFTS